MPEEAWAHSQRHESGSLRRHGLREHLLAVAAGAGALVPAAMQPWARLAGLWHDLGKYRPGFQRYVRADPDAHIEERLPSSSEKTHSAAGALHAVAAFERRWGAAAGAFARPLAYAIAGHHAGLDDWIAGLDDRLYGGRGAASAIELNEALAACHAEAPELLPLPSDFDLRMALTANPSLRSPNRLARSLWVRVIFSALVDADFLDTEAFMSPGKTAARSSFPPLKVYLDQLDAHLDRMAARAAGRADAPVMRARQQVLAACRDGAALPPGVFTLTVPTGGGKTLSSLAFALRHAVAHGRRRVIYAIPYTSIIEQTAAVFADIFGEENLVEHHSQADTPAGGETSASRLACENWDAPLVVTTTVQLFESLFASRTSRCRKLHRVCGSVIVLDEAQLLPPPFLQPILETLDALLAHHEVTLLLCTATQPALTSTSAFDPRHALRGLPQPRPLVEDEASLFAALERVQMHWPEDLEVPIEWPELVPRLEGHDCVLVIVNTRRDALELTAALPPGTLHLSAAMCGAHRKEVIDEIRLRLRQRQGGDPTPLRVVSTQLVEAGVDVDFPVVYRALAGLDSIAQSAGRCNREGRLHRGDLFVFVRPVPRPLGHVRAGVETTRTLKAEGLADSPGPTDFTRYFRMFYRTQKLDAHDITAHLEDRESQFSFDFREAAKKFRLVDEDDQGSLIVPFMDYAAQPERHARLPMLLAMLRAKSADRWVLRDLQRYTISMRLRELSALQANGDVTEHLPGVYLLNDPLRYDRRFGLLPRGSALDATTLVQ